MYSMADLFLRHLYVIELETITFHTVWMDLLLYQDHNAPLIEGFKFVVLILLISNLLILRVEYILFQKELRVLQ